MDRIALVCSLFFSLILATNGGMNTPSVFGRKGYSPVVGALAGAVVGFGATLLLSVALLSVFSDQPAIGVLGGFAGGIAALALLWNLLPAQRADINALPDGIDLKRNIQARHIRGKIMRTLYIISIVVALVSLATLIWTILDRTVGLVAVEYEVEPDELVINGEPTGRPLGDLSKEELGIALAENVRAPRLRIFVLQEVVEASESDQGTLTGQPVSEVLKGKEYPEELAATTFGSLGKEEAAQLLVLNLDEQDLRGLITKEILKPGGVVESWSLRESVLERDKIKARVEAKYPNADLEWKTWLSWDFVTSSLDPRAADVTGLRPAIYGSLMVILITIVIAFPVGVGAAIYLEEYARDNWLNRIIQTNINNLAGVPSIIYGMLGLAIFVRTLGELTSGNIIGTNTPNGRTVFSAGFTLALLVLPLLIINAQEAIRAVPDSLRQASYGLGATQWQTIWNHVLPYSLPGIMTGTILAISRAIGETAPLILVGGATYLTQDPKGPFSSFTAIPLLIYRWTTLPQPEFRNAAAAAIVVLLIVLLSLNSAAIILRNRFTRRLS